MRNTQSSSRLLQGPDESLGNDAILANTMKMSGTNYTCAGQSNGNFNINLFNNFNYTVYVPSNASIEKPYGRGHPAYLGRVR